MNDLIELDKDTAVADMTGILKRTPSESCLDIGCGIGPQTLQRPTRVHHLAEPHQPYLDRAIPKRIMPGDIHAVDWAGALALYKEDSIDTVFLLDVIEHLEKSEGERLLPLTLKIARKMIVIFTPFGFLPQHVEEGEPDGWGMVTGGASLQEHRSGWLPEDFANYNANCFVSRGYHETSTGLHDAMWVVISK